MKIQDTTGRTMLVDLVYNHPSMGWLKAHAVRLHNTVGSDGVRATIHCKVPFGRIGVRVCSLLDTEALVFDNGEKRVNTSTRGGTRPEVIEVDNNRAFLEFRPVGDAQPRVETDMLAGGSDAESEVATEGGAEATSEELVPYTVPQAPEGHGLFFVVVRFAKQNSPYGEPPQEEFELAFQCHEPEDFDEFYAQNFHLVEKAEPVINPRDPMSFTADTDAVAPHFHCHFSGCKH